VVCWRAAAIHTSDTPDRYGVINTVKNAVKKTVKNAVNKTVKNAVRTREKRR
jgi:hypothetical protein